MSNGHANGVRFLATDIFRYFSVLQIQSVDRSISFCVCFESFLTQRRDEVVKYRGVRRIESKMTRESFTTRFVWCIFV